MRTSALLFLFLLLASGLSSCAVMPKSATGPVFVAAQVPPDKAVVYFYRPHALELGARPVFLSIPKEADNCFSMVNSGYKAHVAAPGRLTVMGSVSGENVDFGLTLKAGETRYVKVQPKSSGFTPRADFQEISAGAALPEIRQFRLIDVCPK